MGGEYTPKLMFVMWQVLFFDKHRLIHIIIVFFLDASEIRQSVWYLLHHIAIFFFIHHSYRVNIWKTDECDTFNATNLSVYLLFCAKTAIRGKTAISQEKRLSAEKLQLQPRLCRKLRSYWIFFALFDRIFHHPIFRDVVGGLPWVEMVVLQYRDQHLFHLRVGLCTPVHAQYRQQVGGRVPLRLNIVRSGCPEIEEKILL